MAKFHSAFDARADMFPETMAALDALGEALQEELPVGLRKRLRPGQQMQGEDTEKRVKRLRNAIDWQKMRRKLAERRVKELSCAKGMDGTPLTFIARVCMARPGANSRQFAQTWNDCKGCDGASLSRTTFTSIKDAFITTAKEVYKEALGTQARRSIEPAAACASNTAAPSARPTLASLAEVALHVGLWAFVLRHIHDEAAMRLRSILTTDSGRPVRSRTTKVQQHAATVHFHGEPETPLLTELDGLADKTAATVATSIERVVRDVADTIGSVLATMQNIPLGMLFLMVHILVGDGVPTNNAAAKKLWAAFVEKPPHPRFVYLLICVICASHMANLCMKQAVIGHAAEEGAKNTAAIRASGNVSQARALAIKGQVPHKIVCGVIVRLFKYLLPENYSEFFASLVCWASRLQLVREEGHRPEANERDRKLRTLYSGHVISLELLECLNNGLDSLTHYVEEEEVAQYLADPEALRARWIDRLVEVRRSRELCSDEKATLSRFFTFRENVNTLLVMDLIPEGHQEMIKLVKPKPKTKNSKRMEWVTKLYETPGISQYLRRTVLCMQVTGDLHTLSAQLYEPGDPLLVRLAKGQGRLTVREAVGKVSPGIPAPARPSTAHGPRGSLQRKAPGPRQP